MLHAEKWEACNIEKLGIGLGTRLGKILFLRQPTVSQNATSPALWRSLELRSEPSQTLSASFQLASDRGDL